MEIPNEPLLHDRGRGPEIKTSRITVYDVLDYHRLGWLPPRIAAMFQVTVPEVEAAIRYIGAHEAEVMVEYQKMLDRNARGNPPEVQAKLDSLRGLARRRLAELHVAKEARERGLDDARTAR